ncbi:MAG: protein kinase [Gemmatimonadales bacterium]
MELKDRLQSTLGSAYSIERELGGGGMSRVFLARETSLGRNVVVKVLGGDVAAGLSSERFAREVRLAASLQHPNIVPVLTTGVADGIPYYTMPYVKGESLRARMHDLGTLPRRQIISILRDIARALQYAHSEGVIHRDIKPENVLLSGDAAVVTDFGIAKAISLARTSGAGEQTMTYDGTITQAGSAVGTPAYMAPEQVAAAEIDYRADIYAWGLIAYELLASVHPFAGKVNTLQLMSAQLAEKPAPLESRASDVPPPLADLVMRCLNKEPDDRPASASELLDQLETTHESQERVLPAPASPKRSRYMIPAVTIGVAALIAIATYAFTSTRRKTEASDAISSVAVLPFADTQADSSNAYFGEGIADELMTALGKVPGLRVASRTSAIAMGRRRDLDMREIGRQLGVSTVVEGTVRRSGNQLRVTAQLTNASDGLTIWSDAYERNNKDVFAVQDDITQAIVAALRPEFASRSSILTRSSAMGPGTSDPEAYDLYLRGLYLVERRGPGVGRAADYFSQAIAKDSSFARAYASLASALELFPYFMGVPHRRVEARARAAAERALKLDPVLAEPHVAMAMAHWHASRWNEADAEFRRALAADSTSAVAHTQYGRYLLSIGDIANAISQFRTARRLDPLAATSSMWLSHSLAYAGDWQAALAEGKRARELDPNLLNNRTILVFDLIRAGRAEEARPIVVGAENIPTGFNGMQANALETLGEKARAAAIRSRLDAMPDTTWMIHTARAYAYLSTPDTTRALTEMEKAVDDEMIAQVIPFADRMYDPVRQSARFAAVVRKAGLEGRRLTDTNGGRSSR